MENPEYLEIPEGVLAIEEEAFRRNHSLKRVILPKSLKHIGSNAFYDCIELKEISIPEGGGFRGWRFCILQEPYKD